MMWAILIGLGYVGCLGLFVWYYWRKFKNQPKPRRFQYRITDIWAAMAGLAPTIIVSATAMEKFPEEPGLFIAAAMLGLGQVAGLFAGRLDIQSPPYEAEPSALDSAISIVAGAFLGVLVSACALAVSFVLATIFLGVPHIGILGLPPIVAAIIWSVFRFTNRQRMISSEQSQKTGATPPPSPLPQGEGEPTGQEPS